MCKLYLASDGSLHTGAIIRIPATNLVAPSLKNHKLIKRIEPKEGYVSFIVDTGADVTCLSFVDARNLEIETRYLEQDKGVIGIGGECCTFILKDIEIGLLDSITKDEVQFHIEKIAVTDVLDEKTPKISSILGNDILKRFDIVTDRVKGEATLKRIPTVPGKYRIVSRPLRLLPQTPKKTRKQKK